MPLPWIKMHLEALHDPKLTRLSLAERGAWWGILKLVGECNAGSKIMSGGEGLSIDEIADALHIKTAEDRQALESMITKMEKRGSLMWNETHILTVVHYEERQRLPPSALPEAVAERVRRHRKRLKGGEGEVTPEEGDIINILGKLTGWQADEDDITWLREFKVEFPDFTLAELKACADYNSGKPIPKHKGIWKNRLRNWMTKKLEFERRQGGQPRKPKQTRAKGPLTYIPGSGEPGEEDSEDMP